MTIADNMDTTKVSGVSLHSKAGVFFFLKLEFVLFSDLLFHIKKKKPFAKLKALFDVASVCWCMSANASISHRVLICT